MGQPLTQYEMLLRDARIGEEARKFLKSELGRFIWKRMAEADEEATIKLKTVDPFDGKAVQAIQNEIHIALMAKKFFVEAIIVGDNSRKILESEDQEEQFDQYIEGDEDGYDAQ